MVSGAVPLTDFQVAYSRAGHAHAGVLVILGLVGVLLADSTRMHGGVLGYLARLGVPVAAVLMPAGFLSSSAGDGATEPNSLIVLLWVGAANLTAGVFALGFGLIREGFAPRER